MSLIEKQPLFEEMSQDVQRFIVSSVVAGELVLPYHYPQIDELAAWQVGFATHGLTGESLVSTSQGDWQPGWYVIARNYFDDPFFIDVNEADINFPVYYAHHGAGSWKATITAPNILRFSQIINRLCELEEKHAEALLFLETETDVSLPFWLEVYEERYNRAHEEEESEAQVEDDQNDHQRGMLVITNIGPQKLKVVQILRRTLDVSLSEALALAAQPEIIVGSGFLIRQRHIWEQLSEQGATVVFRPDATTAT